MEDKGPDHPDKEGNLAWDEPKKATPAPVKETVQKEAEKQQDLFEEKPAETVTEEEIAVPEEVSSEEPVPPEEEKPVSKKKTGAKKAVAKKK